MEILPQMIYRLTESLPKFQQIFIYLRKTCQAGSWETILHEYFTVLHNLGLLSTEHVGTTKAVEA